MLCHIKDHNGGFTVVARNRSFTFDASHPDYLGLIETIKQGLESEFIDMWSQDRKIESWSHGDFRVGNGRLLYQDEVIHDTITERVVSMIRDGFDYMPMLRFIENLYRNPSYRAINELYTFLRHKFLPITDDGCFLAYKAVTNNYLDKHSNTFDNRVGKLVEIPRHKVDDNCGVGCGQGLHVGAIEYVRGYASVGDRVVICKVNPADVVSVPLDSEQQKVRCCRYEVVADYEGEISELVKNYDNDDNEEDKFWFGEDE